MTEKLLPCPFCGGEPKLRTHRSGEDSMECYVECPSCEVRTTYYEDAYAPVADARGAWNRRTPPPSSHVAVEADLIERVENCVLFSTPAEYAGLADHAAFEAGQDNAIASVVKMLRAALATTEGKDNG